MHMIEDDFVAQFKAILRKILPHVRAVLEIYKL